MLHLPHPCRQTLILHLRENPATYKHVSHNSPIHLRHPLFQFHSQQLQDLVLHAPWCLQEDHFHHTNSQVCIRLLSSQRPKTFLDPSHKFPFLLAHRHFLEITTNIASLWELKHQLFWSPGIKAFNWAKSPVLFRVKWKKNPKKPKPTRHRCPWTLGNSTRHRCLWTLEFSYKALRQFLTDSLALKHNSFSGRS